MITRIKIDGFKSLVGVDLFLGPFTCIAGANAVGKSNLFDAILFLSHLADKTLVEAAKMVRSEGKRNSNIRDIFHKHGNEYSNRISFEVSMLIKPETEDDLGQPARASITSVQYNLVIRYNEQDDEEPIVIEKEELLPITLREARRDVHFKASATWKSDVIHGRRNVPFISTEEGLVQIHQEGKGGLAKYRPPKMPRTLLSIATGEYQTAFLVRHEMRNWRMLQLEPGALRNPDDFDARRNAQLATDGAHLAATLYRLHLENKEIDIYQRVVNELSNIVSGLDEVMIDKDEKRELLTLNVKYRNGDVFAANTLSDGTLRFLALTVLQLDNSTDGVICFEEPENGIHPLKIEAIIQLLQSIAVDTDYGIVDQGNPFRQVIINTHSPVVVSIVPEDSLLMADFQEAYDESSKSRYRRTVFKYLPDTWRDRTEKSGDTITKGALLNYLNPVETEPVREMYVPQKSGKRVIDRNGMKGQPELNF